VNKKILIGIPLIVVVVIALYLATNLNLDSRIFCYARENDSSKWYRTDDCPTYAEGEEVSLGIVVVNNFSCTLYNIRVEVTYKTTSNAWNTTSRNIGLIDIEGRKQVRFYLSNPKLEAWTFNTTIGYHPTRYGIVTRYVLNSTNYKIKAYGFPQT
jgi:hypothetical protein